MIANTPNFIIIGAGKSGTTSLYEYLLEHPEVYMSPVKETNFFALEGEKLKDAKDDPDQMHHYPWSITEWSDYEDLFKGVTTEKAVGEVSPMYLYSEKAAVNIKRKLPNVKLIAILRNPVDRLYSRYMHLVRENRQPTNNFEDALKRETIWWRRNDLVQEGFYYSHLKKYYDLFDESQISVYFYEDFRSNPQRVIKDIYRFIGVDDTFLPDFSTEYNVSGKIKNQAFDKLIGQQSVLKSTLSKMSPQLVRWVQSQSSIKKWVNKFRKMNLEKAPLSESTREKLIKQVYQSEIKALQQLVGRDLTNWLTIKNQLS
ncbi:sulfotransferase family protein [Ekhidna sp.]|uniref:sulfotransferase family protein n=1 Tax=Ekhidna sp. TaxID=2608089 RepID=UPI003CCB8C6E